MRMHEHISRKVYLTYWSVKSWKSSILGIHLIENVDLAAFSKDFLLLNNRKQTMRTKRVCPQISDLENWYEVSPYRSKSTGLVSLETYLPDIKVKRYRTCRADRLRNTVDHIFLSANCPCAKDAKLLIVSDVPLKRSNVGIVITPLQNICRYSSML